MGAVLEADGLFRAFGGFPAVNGVSLRIAPDSVHALIGPNGAGKTTLFNLLSRFLAPDRGRIRFLGSDITTLGPAAVARRGLVRSFQISSIFPGLSALQNVKLALARHARGQSLDWWRGPRVLDRFDERAHALLNEVGIAELAARPASELAYGVKRALELATTLALDPILLLLDEPTAGMTQADAEHVVFLIRRIRAGRTVLMVEHNLDVVEGLCDRVTALVRGRVAAEGDYATVAADPAVREAYLGTGAIGGA